MDEHPTNSSAPDPSPSGGALSSHAAQQSNPAPDFVHLERASTSDEAPTIISRALHAPVPTEALGVVLRGRRLAHFELLEPIGVGGMAAVIRARDMQLDRSVALKILPPEMARDPENVRRFQHEARAAAKLDHENIARVFYCGEDQGLYFIAFEFVEGETLRKIVDREGKLSVPRAIGYMLQVASGLAHAAGRGVVHRDIKPSNIIVTPTGRAKLVDMGLARSLEKQADGALTRSGVTLGTIDYISPEQALEPRDADIRSDIYSLGCTFYHMLTGQPPVPEGTAARKLHHQQHVPPVDPRQLNTDIPDEVAALLARMMAKDPAERFQDPERLVNQLLVLAKKYPDAADSAADGVIWVDALVPDPPRVKPLLFAVSAVLALVILIVILSPPVPWAAPTSDAGTANPIRGAGEPGDERGSLQVNDENTEPPRRANPAYANAEATRTNVFEPASERELAELLQRSDATSRLEVELGHDLKLSRADALVFRGRELIIRAKDPRLPPMIRLQYDGSPPSEPWAALTIKGGRVRIENIRFVIDATEASDLTMCAVSVEAGQVTLKRCEFVQEYPPAVRDGNVSSVSVLKPVLNTERPSVDLVECYFGEGQRAVNMTGSVGVKCLQCAFAPQSSAVFEIQLGELPDDNSPATVTLINTSSIVSDGSVFRLQQGAVCRLEADACIFSRPEAFSPDRGAALVEQVGQFGSDPKYRGFNNCYHNLKYLLLRASGQDVKEMVTDLDGFRTRIGIQDEHSFVAPASPWESSDVVRALQSRNLAQAFRLKTDLAELRQPKNPTRMIGVETCVWGNTYDKLLALATPSHTDTALRGSDRIVDPSLTAPSTNTYQTLRQALEAASPGDTILIRHNGILRVEPVRLEKAASDITIRPFANCQPVLSIGDTTEPDAALFRIYDGRLTLERLEFQIQPRQAEFKAQAVVAIMGDGQCTFKNCLATLEETKEVPVSLVTLADPASVMKMNPAPAGQAEPRVQLDGCFVRGAGDLISVRASRPVDAVIEDTLAVLDGSLFVVDGNPNQKDVAGRTRFVTLTLNRVTTYLTDHLVWLRAHRQDGMNSRGLVPTQVRAATNCLFASANGKSLVHLDGVDNEDQMKRLFTWSDGRHNAYSNYNTWLDQKPGTESESMAPLPYGKSQWESFAQESDSRVERVRFGIPLPVELPLFRATADNFKLAGDTNGQGYGAEVDRLPRPYEAIESGR
jgi:serine/threonine protein kinase